jgi:TP901 family phage tail tape measure protein
MAKVNLTANITKLNISTRVASAINHSIGDAVKLNASAIGAITRGVTTGVKNALLGLNQKPFNVSLDYTLSPKFASFLNTVHVIKVRPELAAGAGAEIRQALGAINARIPLAAGQIAVDPNRVRQPIRTVAVAPQVTTASERNLSTALRERREISTGMPNIPGIITPLHPSGPSSSKVTAKVYSDFPEKFHYSQTGGVQQFEQYNQIGVNKIFSDFLNKVRGLQETHIAAGPAGGIGREGKGSPLFMMHGGQDIEQAGVNWEKMQEAIGGADSAAVGMYKTMDGLKRVAVSVGTASTNPAENAANSQKKIRDNMVIAGANVKDINKITYDLFSVFDTIGKLKNIPGSQNVDFLGANMTFGRSHEGAAGLVPNLPTLLSGLGHQMPTSRTALIDTITKLQASGHKDLLQATASAYSVKMGKSGITSFPLTDESIAELSGNILKFGNLIKVGFLDRPHSTTSSKDDPNVAHADRLLAMSRNANATKDLQNSFMGSAARVPGMTEETAKQLAFISKTSDDSASAMSRFAAQANKAKGFVAEMSEQIHRAAIRLSSWGIVSTGIFAGFQLITTMFRDVVTYEREVAEATKVLGTVRAENMLLSQSVQASAKSYGINVIEAAKAAAVFAQQGLNMGQVMSLTDASLKLSKVSVLSTTQSTEVLTSVMNQFNVTAKDTVKVVDILNEVADKHAVTEGDLAQAIFKTGSTAAETGTKFEELLGMVTAMQSTTRRGGNVIGTALNTMMTRLYSDDFIKQMHKYNIEVVDGYGSYKSGYAILDELSRKWGSLSDAQRNHIGLAAGGRRQYSLFLALMNNFKEAQESVIDAQNSAGSANKELVRILATTAERWNVLWASIQTGSQRVLSPVIDQFTKLASIMGSLGGFGSVLGIGAAVGGYLLHSKTKKDYSTLGPLGLKDTKTSLLGIGQTRLSQPIAEISKSFSMDYWNPKNYKSSSHANWKNLEEKKILEVSKKRQMSVLDRVYEEIMATPVPRPKKSLGSIEQEMLVKSKKLAFDVNEGRDLQSQYLEEITGGSASTRAARKIRTRAMSTGTFALTERGLDQEQAARLGGKVPVALRLLPELEEAQEIARKLQSGWREKLHNKIKSARDKIADTLLPVDIGEDIKQRLSNTGISEKDYKGAVRRQWAAEKGSRALSALFVGQLVGGISQGLFENIAVGIHAQKAQEGYVGEAQAATKRSIWARAGGAALGGAFTGGMIGGPAGFGIGAVVGAGSVLIHYNSEMEQAAKSDLDALGKATNTIRNYVQDAASILRTGMNRTSEGAERLAKNVKEITDNAKKAGYDPNKIVSRVLSGDSAKNIQKDIEKERYKKILKETENVSLEDRTSSMAEIIGKSATGQLEGKEFSAKELIDKFTLETSGGDSWIARLFGAEDNGYEKLKNINSTGAMSIFQGLFSNIGPQILQQIGPDAQFTMASAYGKMQESGVNLRDYFNQQAQDAGLERGSWKGDLGAELRKDKTAVAIGKRGTDFADQMYTIAENSDGTYVAINAATGKIERVAKSWDELNKNFDAVNDEALGGIGTLGKGLKAAAKWRSDMEVFNSIWKGVGEEISKGLGVIQSNIFGRDIQKSVGNRFNERTMREASKAMGIDPEADVMQQVTAAGDLKNAVGYAKNNTLELIDKAYSEKLIDAYFESGGKLSGPENAVARSLIADKMGSEDKPTNEWRAAHAQQLAKLGIKNSDQLKSSESDYEAIEKEVSATFDKLTDAARSILDSWSKDWTNLGKATSTYSTVFDYKGMREAINPIIEKLKSSKETEVTYAYTAALDIYFGTLDSMIENNNHIFDIHAKKLGTTIKGIDTSFLSTEPDIFGRQNILQRGMEYNAINSVGQTDLGINQAQLKQEQERRTRGFNLMSGSLPGGDAYEEGRKQVAEAEKNILTITEKNIAITNQEYDALLNVTKARQQSITAIKNEREALVGKLLTFGEKPKLEQETIMSVSKALKGSMGNDEMMTSFISQMMTLGGGSKVQEALGYMSPEDRESITKQLGKIAPKLKGPGASFIGPLIASLNKEQGGLQGKVDEEKDRLSKLTNQITTIYDTLEKKMADTVANQTKILGELVPAMDSVTNKVKEFTEGIKKLHETKVDKLEQAFDVDVMVHHNGQVAFNMPEDFVKLFMGKFGEEFAKWLAAEREKQKKEEAERNASGQK